MSEIKALEKLREKISLDVNNPWSDLKGDLLAMCDKVEAEITERYIELPRLCDGIIKPGDTIESLYDGESFIKDVDALIWDGDRWDFDLSDEDGDTRDCASLDDFYECSRHVKPRTLEDVLQCAGVSIAAIGDVAAEIRELLVVEQ